MLIKRFNTRQEALKESYNYLLKGRYCKIRKTKDKWELWISAKK